METSEHIKPFDPREPIEDLCKAMHEYRLDHLCFDYFGNKVIIYSPNWWIYESIFYDRFWPVDDQWIKMYGVTNIKFQFRHMGVQFIIKDWKDRIVNDTNKLKIANLWHPLNEGYYPTAKQKVWLYADDGKGLAEAIFDYDLQKFLYGHNDVEKYQEKRKFTHWQEMDVPK